MTLLWPIQLLVCGAVRRFCPFLLAVFGSHVKRSKTVEVYLLVAVDQPWIGVRNPTSRMLLLETVVAARNSCRIHG